MTRVAIRVTMSLSGYGTIHHAYDGAASSNSEDVHLQKTFRLE